jgi:predicted metal-dependent peptidase
VAEDLSDPVYKEIVTARIKLLLEKPFFGNMTVRLVLKEAPWCRTAATDGRNLYYNREFIKGLTRPQLLFLLAHEVMHVIYDHLGRRGNRDPKIWNMATDYNINYGLVREKIGQMPEMGLYDEKYTDEMSAGEIYDLLKKNSVTIKMPLDDHLDLGNDSDSNDSDDGDDDGEGEGNGQGKGGKGKQRTTSVTVMGKDGPPKLTEEDLQKIRNDLKAAVIQTAQQVGAGNVPLGVKRLISELVEPKLDWRTLLDAHIRSAMKDDYTFQRLSRRTWGTGAIMPAQNFIDRVEVFIAIDASGSTSQSMVTDFLSEVKGICDSFRDYFLKIVCFDTEVYNYYEFTPENADDIPNYTIRGGGGTEFSAVTEFIKRESHEPNRLVWLTDGMPNSTWGEENICDQIFIIHSNAHINAPWGLTAHIDADDKIMRRKS